MADTFLSPGRVMLVFLPGLTTIQQAQEAFNAPQRDGYSTGVIHSLLSPEEQEESLRQPDREKRKVCSSRDGRQQYMSQEG